MIPNREPGREVAARRMSEGHDALEIEAIAAAKNLEMVEGASQIQKRSRPAAAIVTAASSPKLLPIVIPLAVLIAISRVVLGLHYVSDVIVGALLGFVLAWGSGLAALFFWGG